MLEKIDVHLTDHCNLNCKGCTHFSSIADEFFLDIDEFEKDMKRVSTLSNGEIKEIYLLGGEPLLHKDISEFFPIARNLFRNSKLIVITNGILLNDMSDNFWKSLRRSDVQVWVSAYNLNIDYKAFEKKAKDNGVFLGYTSRTTNDKNQKLWTKFKLDIEGKQYYLNSFGNCAIRNCVTLKHGKLYTCPTMAHIEHFNKQFNLNLEPKEWDYVDIYKVQSWNEVLAQLVKPVSFCRFCRPKDHETIFWGPTKKELSEWT